jgi:putative (di)nucleoside polyphosphate hydrolase
LTEEKQIRKAVGAVIFQGQDILLVHKVKAGLLEEWPGQVGGEWDFPKGGIEQSDSSLEEALMRELYEETGSTQYQVVRGLEEKICFDFPASIIEKSGYEKQETEMFLVEYMGDRLDIHPCDEEIREARFYPLEEVEEKLTHADTRELWRKVRGLV